MPLGLAGENIIRIDVLGNEERYRVSHRQRTRLPVPPWTEIATKARSWGSVSRDVV